MMKRFIWNISVVLYSSLFILPTPDCFSEPREDEVIAILNGKPIYLSEVEQNVAFRLYRLRGNIHMLLKNETEEIVRQRLLSAEAQRRGISLDALLQREVDEKTSPVNEMEVDQYLKEHPQGDAVDSERRNRIRTFLLQQAVSRRKNEFIAALQKEADYQFLREMPERPRMKMNIEGEPWQGNPEAPVTLVHFANFSCSVCSQSAQMITRAMEEFPGKLKWIHRNYFNMFNEKALIAAQVGEFAFENDKFWEFHDIMMALDGQYELENVLQIAVDLDLDQECYHEGEREGRFLTAVRKDIRDANRLGVTSTPVIFVNGRYFSGTFPYDQLKTQIREELDRTKKK